MKTKKCLLLLFFALSTLPLFSQNPIECGFHPDDAYLNEVMNPNSLINKRRKFVRTIPLKDLNRVEIIEYKKGKFKVLADDKSKDADAIDRSSIPVVVHNVRNDDGSGGVSDAEIIGMIDVLNARYDPYGFHFILCAIRNINNSTIFQNQFDSKVDSANLNTASYHVLDVTNRNIQEKINFYIVPTANTSWAFRPNNIPIRQHIVVAQKHVNNSSTIAHEVGHWFGLFHTHGKNGRDELVQRTNCEVTGDFLCDTPADPSLIQNGEYWVNLECGYAPKRDLRDTNGDLYAPDTRNIMSYSIKDCRIAFSNEQAYTMQENYISMEDYRDYKLSACGTQKGWRWCVKCQVLFFTGDGQDSGVCPAGQKHTPNPTATDSRKSGKYILDRGEAVVSQQDGWRWCNKCQGLFFSADHDDAGACPTGNKHTVNATATDNRRSGLYSLDCRQAANPTSTGQQKWRQCGKCQGLFFSSNGEASGVCPGQDKHEPNGKKDTVNHYAVKRQ